MYSNRTRVDCVRVAREVPFGTVMVTAELGGLDLVDAEANKTTAIAAAAVAAKLDLPDGEFTL